MGAGRKGEGESQASASPWIFGKIKIEKKGNKANINTKN
jgi:hypothetical protein